MFGKVARAALFNARAFYFYSCRYDAALHESKPIAKRYFCAIFYISVEISILTGALAHQNVTGILPVPENNMPKIKTNRAAAKRFKKTGTGKFVYTKSHHNHILTKKTTKRKRSLRKSLLCDKSNTRELKLLLPNG